MTTAFTLADSPKVRYATGTMMYFAQGIPYGLLSITIPAWLASQGASAADIGSYLAVIILPWAFKLVTGPFMDRFQFRPMGKRRPWVLAAQFGLTLSFLALVLIENPAEQMGLLMLIGVLINIFAATQDVAVDGMSIDLTPVREQGRLNAFMSFGKAVGWGVTSAVSGFLVMNFGMQVTALVAAAVSAIVLLAFANVLEHEGERRLPWSAGRAASQRQKPDTFGSVFSGVNEVLWTRTSVIIMLIMFSDGLISGFGHTLMPIAAVNLFGYTTQQWSQLVAMMGLTGAVVALSLGPVIDRIGAKRILFLTISLVGLHAVLIAQTQSMWQDTLYIKVMLSVWVLMSPVVMVCIIALAMAICSSGNSATQFAIYMSVANLGHSVGSKFYGMISERSSYVESYLLMAALVVAMIIILYFHRHRHDQDEENGPKRVQTYALGTGGNGAGMYFSGAMRCPKCRCDMEQVKIDNTIIDRCTSCAGIWFDEGELEVLNHQDAATAIDTGKKAVGRQHNLIDDYRCPRCGGQVDKKVDPQQQHIWYETCLECNGSFFDAGEFRDLAQVTISDFFKKFVTPKREH